MKDEQTKNIQRIFQGTGGEAGQDAHMCGTIGLFGRTSKDTAGGEMMNKQKMDVISDGLER